MSEQVRIGEPLTGNEQRDAIHVGIVPCVTGKEYMRPGEPVRLAYGTTNVILPAEYGGDIGIIDPWLKWEHCREQGSKVYVMLKPGTITGLRHHWTHPAFDSPQVAVSEAEKWLRLFASKWDFRYDEMIEIATKGSIKSKIELPASLGLSPVEFDADHITAHGVDLHSAHELGEDYELFWQNLEALTGQTFGDEHRSKVGWTCTC